MAWEKVKLGDVATSIQTGPFGSQLHQSDYSEIGIPVVMPKDMINGKIIEDSIARVEEKHVERLCRHKVSLGDILYARRGDVGKCSLVTKKEIGWLCGTGCLKVSIDFSKANPQFVFYQLQKPETVGWVEKHAVGATMLNLNTGILESVPIEIPSLKQQNKIVDILSAYDNLIENNQKQIKLLEEAAQRLYKQWFIDLKYPGHETTPIKDGLPEGWIARTTDDIAEYINGFAFKPSDWGEKGLPIIKIKELNDGVSNDTPRNSGESVPSKNWVKNGDILFSWSATLLAMIWDAEEGLLNQHLFKVVPKKGCCREFVLQSIKNALDEFQNLTTGSTMKHIQRGKLKEVYVNCPPNHIMRAYEHISEPIRNQILKKKKQIINLRESRDRLLPKLMNGELFEKNA